MSKYISTLQIPPPPVIHAAQSTAAPMPPAQSPPTAVISPSQFVTSIVSKSKSQYLLPLNKKPKVSTELPLSPPLPKNASVELSAMDTSSPPSLPTAETPGQAPQTPTQ
ncbi:hypothetical protein JTE90_026486 [Oedothorax gibbosus]|uniref:WW domain containing adaptor with coiled-coil n=1 Tax=Oedothorax gibbosus TaxID=931172 RepID=A0AAV6VS58_9ARAC|nr:hypothetical protein JTE90_026486 [Oedothorax gibbosus]